MSQKLVVIEGPDSGRSFSLESGQTLKIGRGQASDTQINDARLSRVHCRVEVDEQGPQLFDDASTGGTFIGGERITSQRLKPGDVILSGAPLGGLVGVQDRAIRDGDILEVEIERVGRLAVYVRGAAATRPGRSE